MKFVFCRLEYSLIYSTWSCCKSGYIYFLCLLISCSYVLIMLYKFVAKMCAISQDTVRVLIDYIFTGLKNTRLVLCWVCDANGNCDLT